VKKVIAPRHYVAADGASLGAFTVRLYAWAATEFGRIDYTYENDHTETELTALRRS